MTSRLAPKPRHVGPKILPNYPMFNRLLGHAVRDNAVVIDDVTNGFSATHQQLLSDALKVRNVLYDSLKDETRERLWQGDEVFFTLLAPATYEYAVAFLAILAIGGVVVPISPVLPLQEALYFVRKSQSVAILTSARCADLGRGIKAQIKKSNDSSFQSLEIRPLIFNPIIPPSEIIISSDHFLNYHGPGLVIFTSGTTGLPKGAVRSRAFLVEAATTLADVYELRRTDVVMHSLPVHHATGIGTTFLPFLLCGARIEFYSGGFDAKMFWDRWRKGGLTIFSGVPTLYMRLMRYYEESICKLPASEQAEYVQGVRNFKALMCGTAALPRPLQQKWSALLGDGRRILQRYGTTEFSSGMSVSAKDKQVPDGSVGRHAPGMDVILSEGDEGEILIKAPFMFSKYIFDPVATAKAFTPDGYYKTGDIARKENGYYFIMGRASIDILKSGGYKISALDIEREILGLDYISEVMVVGVEDEEFGQRVAAGVVLKDEVNGKLTLDTLREDLRSKLAGYKMPTLLRVVTDLPKTASGKVTKKALTPVLFPAAGHPDVQAWKRKERSAKLSDTAVEMISLLHLRSTLSISESRAEVVETFVQRLRTHFYGVMSTYPFGAAPWDVDKLPNVLGELKMKIFILRNQGGRVYIRDWRRYTKLQRRKRSLMDAISKIKDLDGIVERKLAEDEMFDEVRQCAEAACKRWEVLRMLRTRRYEPNVAREYERVADEQIVLAVRALNRLHEAQTRQ